MRRTLLGWILGSFAAMVAFGWVLRVGGLGLLAIPSALAVGILAGGATWTVIKDGPGALRALFARDQSR